MKYNLDRNLFTGLVQVRSFAMVLAVSNGPGVGGPTQEVQVADQEATGRHHVTTVRKARCVLRQELVEEQEQRLRLGALQLAVGLGCAPQVAGADLRDLGQVTPPLGPNPSVHLMGKVER